MILTNAVSVKANPGAGKRGSEGASQEYFGNERRFVVGAGKNLDMRRRA
jgi:hypothetical protein